MTEPVIGHATVRHAGWVRSPHSTAEGPPPHTEPFSSSVLASLSIEWADAEQTIPVAAQDYDGCRAVVIGPVVPVEAGAGQEEAP